jgi:hypothetical protein
MCVIAFSVPGAELRSEGTDECVRPYAGGWLMGNISSIVIIS